MSPVVIAARALLGVPWRHLGRAARGVDCLGLCILAYRAAGFVVPDPTPYRREPQGQAILDGLHALGAVRVAADDERDGDVMLFRVGVYAGHVGIRTTHPTLRMPDCVHAYLPRRKVVEEPIGLELAEHYLGSYRMGAR